MKKLSWILNIVLLIIVGVMFYMFMIKGSTNQTEDGRTAIMISEGERIKVLGDMRKFLDHVQTMVEAIGDDDIEKFSTAASGVGLAQEAPPPPGLVRKLPLEFKTMGIATHTAFDDLAKAADNGANGQELAKELSVIMSNCTTCHSAYRLEIEAD